MAKTAYLLSMVVYKVAVVLSLLYGALIAAILVNVTLRYGFNSGFIVFEEIQWHLYAIAMMFGLSFAEVTNSQVRVDVVASKLKPKTAKMWELFGAVFFVLPFIFVVVYNGISYVGDSYMVNESSNSPLGLPYRWAIKAVIPASFLLLAVAIVARIVNNIDALLSESEV